MLEVGTRLHAVTDVLVVVLLFGAVPLAYFVGMYHGRRQVDPHARAWHLYHKERAMVTPLVGDCGITPPGFGKDRPCGRAAGHADGWHVWKGKDGSRITWESAARSTPRTLDDL